MTTQKTIGELEKGRVEIQARLDSLKTQAERNRLGQFATPPALAEEILDYARNLLSPDDPIRFLDPAFGTGPFYSALLRHFPAARLKAAWGVEIDAHYGQPARELWAGTALEIRLADFTQLEPPAKRFNLLLCNPPYVRHHHLANEEKAALQLRTLRASGIKISGLAGLYCHFLGLSHAWLEPGALSGWLIPSEFMDVNYGQAIKRYLLERVTLLHIHRFDPNEVQFADALVSSAVVWFRNTPPPEGHEVRFTFGGKLQSPALSKHVSLRALTYERKWTRFPSADIRLQSDGPTISDFFQIKRGLATGHNGYFILSEEALAERKLPKECFRPILPSPRHIMADEIESDEEGNPCLERRLFLLDSNFDEEEIRERFPTLWEYLQEGKAQNLHERYLCRHRTRWYAQEDRPPPPIVCTYMGRGSGRNGRPFRFILNHSKATVANVYLAMYPAPVLLRAMAGDSRLIRRVWEILNDINLDQLLGEGRVYGGGLHKLEPRELGNVPAPKIAALFPRYQKPPYQKSMFELLTSE